MVQNVVMASPFLRQRSKDTNGSAQCPPPQLKAAPGGRLLPLRAEPRLISWHELPDWMRDNEYILSGYRREMNSVFACMHSIFAYVHNETVNIHSHLWGALLFAFLLATFPTYLAAYPSANNWDFAFFTFFLTGAVACLSFSAFFHTFTAHSKSMSETCYSLDYVGIIVLILGTNISSTYYLFYCHRHLRILHAIGVLTAAISSAYIVLSPKYSSPEYRTARAVVFSALGLMGVIPASHGIYLFGYDTVSRVQGYRWFFDGALVYLAGAVIYANRFPERWWPGRFDRWGASHQILHFHVVAAVLLHYMGVKAGADYWHGVVHGTCPVNVS